MKSNVLLLTATINSQKGVPALARVDPDQRRADYVRALRFYLGFLGRGLDRIVLVENSASDLTDLQRLVREARAEDRVEFISFFGQDFPPEFGRAYSEFLAVDYAHEHAEAFRKGGDVVTWKVTGRYLVTNFLQIITTQPRAFNLYCNLRNYPSRWADLYLLAWDRAGYDGIIKGLGPRLRGDLCQGSPENDFRLVVDASRRRYRVVPRFRHIPRIDAVRGYDNKNYIEGVGRGKLLARNFALWVTPWIWI